jgi:hypothetical protein
MEGSGRRGGGVTSFAGLQGCVGGAQQRPEGTDAVVPEAPEFRLTQSVQAHAFDLLRPSMSYRY